MLKVFSRDKRHRSSLALSANLRSRKISHQVQCSAPSVDYDGYINYKLTESEVAGLHKIEAEAMRARLTLFDVMYGIINCVKVISVLVS